MWGTGLPMSCLSLISSSGRDAAGLSPFIQSDDPPVYPVASLDDVELKRDVGAFKRCGFFWGGKWFHCDTMHLEYRPQLIR